MLSFLQVSPLLPALFLPALFPVPVLLFPEGGKTPWKNDTKGYVSIVRENGKNTYSVYLVDESENVVEDSSTNGAGKAAAFNSLTRTNVKTAAADTYKNFGKTGGINPSGVRCDVR